MCDQRGNFYTEQQRKEDMQQPVYNQPNELLHQKVLLSSVKQLACCSKRKYRHIQALMGTWAGSTE